MIYGFDKDSLNKINAKSVQFRRHKNDTFFLVGVYDNSDKKKRV